MKLIVFLLVVLALPCQAQVKGALGGKSQADQKLPYEYTFCIRPAPDGKLLRDRVVGSLDVRQARIRGTVLNAKGAVSKAEGFFFLPDSLFTNFQAISFQTDSVGHFALYLNPGSYQLIVSDESYPDDRQEYVGLFNLMPAEVRELEILIGKTYPITTIQVRTPMPLSEEEYKKEYERLAVELKRVEKVK